MFNLYTIRDNKSGQWQSPVADYNDATMRRGVAAGLSGSDLRSFSPADFEVFNVGTFDPESGCVTAQLPAYVCSIADIVREEMSENAPEK